MADRQTPCSMGFQCFLFLLVICPIILLLGAILMALPPEFKVVSLQVPPITVTTLGESSMLMCATWNITFFAKNRNMWSTVNYDNVHVSINYDWAPLATQRVPFFKQCKGCKGLVHVTVSEPVEVNRMVMDSMAEDAQDTLAVDFNVQLRGKVKVYVWDRIGITHHLSVNCYDVRVGFPPQVGTATMLDPSKKCDSGGHPLGF